MMSPMDVHPRPIREGRLQVLLRKGRGSLFLDACLTCGAPVGEEVTSEWARVPKPPWLVAVYATLVVSVVGGPVGIVIGLVALQALEKQFPDIAIEVALCRACAARRRQGRVMAGVLISAALVGVGYSVVAPSHNALLFWLSAALLLAGALHWQRASRLLRVESREPHQVTLLGLPDALLPSKRKRTQA